VYFDKPGSALKACGRLQSLTWKDAHGSGPLTRCSNYEQQAAALVMLHSAQQRHPVMW
jgi:hypothetical protein